MRKLRIVLRIFLKAITSIVGLLIILIIVFKITSKIDTPQVSNSALENLQATQVDSTYSYFEKNWLKKNEFGLWEMYLEGLAFDRGLAHGKLSKDLIYKQETAFVNQIKTMIPSESYLKFLKSFIGFFNRNIDKHIIDEYQQEIFGISMSASNEFDFIAPNYQRMLNYHAAHDIGHALQNMNLVACTAFSGWDSRSKDSSLIIGRNFDFYVGDEFAEEKVIMFFNPDKGYKFMIVSWASMIGATSGMNNQGITVTLNAAKSDIPYAAATPISLLAREILQYASNIEEAIEITKKRKTFVSESLFIGSAKDGETVTIEKSPDNQAVLISVNDYLICSNHFQNPEMQNDEYKNSITCDYATTYRMERVEELLNKNKRLDIESVVAILRDQKGLKNENIGMGNEKAINQLIAHHSVIFKPEELKVWVSTAPFQLGEYICYDLNKVFEKADKSSKPTIMYESDLTIPVDSFIYSNEFTKFNRFKDIRSQIKNAIKTNSRIPDEDYLFNEFIETNSMFFETYVNLGDYFVHFEINEKALFAYKKALKKEIPNIYQRENIIAKISELEN